MPMPIEKNDLEVAKNVTQLIVKTYEICKDAYKKIMDKPVLIAAITKEYDNGNIRVCSTYETKRSKERIYKNILYKNRMSYDRDN